MIVDADTLLFNEYCYDLENGWVMLASQPDSGINVIVEASVSWDIDMGITNWDNDIGNYLFFNSTNPVYATHEELFPEGFVLYQNYPNPFNPSTTIRFSLPQRSDIALVIYDELGNEIRTLVSGDHEAGTYEVDFDATGLSSGIYFYQIKSASFSETRKLVLMK